MDAWVYFKLVFRATGRRSLDWAQAIIFLIIALAGTVVLIGPRFGVDVNISGLVSLVADPRSYAVLFGSIVATRLIVSPYWVWQDERRTKEAAETLASSNRGMGMREISALHDQASAIREQASEMRLQRQRAENVDESYANLRIADCPEILELFHNYDPKMTGLLASGTLKSWARSNGDSRLLPVKSEMWVTNRLAFYPKGPGSVPDGINQTFLRSADGRSVRYDICLNASQIRKFWPELPNIAPTELPL